MRNDYKVDNVDMHTYTHTVNTYIHIHITYAHTHIHTHTGPAGNDEDHLEATGEVPRG